MFFDADVLIWVFRGRPSAAEQVKSAAIRLISDVAYMELIQGAFDKAEVRTMRRFLYDHGFRRIPITENIGQRACVYMEEYGLRSSMDLADALIASTAVEHQVPLCTANVKHFREITDLELVPYR